MTQFRPTRFEVLPTIVKNLLIINGLLFLAQNTFAGPTSTFSFEDYLALHAWQSELFKPWQLITHMFLHGGTMFSDSPNYEEGFMHLFGNMFGLWMFGSLLEQHWGTKRFTWFYLLCGIGAGVAQLLYLYFQQRDMIQVIDSSAVGASGAVFGILGAFAYLFPNTELYLYFMFPIKMKYAIALYAAYEIYTGIKQSVGDNVAHFAHLGGLERITLVVEPFRSQ
jgi:membrane associated rhomboid family serine protease